MRGYKGFDKDLKCRGMQYEVGKTYHQDGEIKICKNGFHFCKNLVDVFSFYEINDDSRYCEVEAFGKIDSCHNKSAASDIRIIRELSKSEINRCKYGNGSGYARRYFGTGNGNPLYSIDYFTGRGDGDGISYYQGTCYGDGSHYGDGDGNSSSYYITHYDRGDGNDKIHNILIFEEV